MKRFSPLPLPLAKTTVAEGDMGKGRKKMQETAATASIMTSRSLPKGGPSGPSQKFGDLGWSFLESFALSVLLPLGPP